jgi:hypothetical protein
LGLAALTWENISLGGKPFIWGLIVMFFLNAVLVRLLFAYTGRRRFPPAAVLLCALIICNIIFYDSMRGLTRHAQAQVPAPSPVPTAVAPPHRDYSFLKEHTIEWDDRRGTITAVDGDGFRLTLRRDDPRQVFPEAFSIMMGKEKARPSSDEAMLSLGRLMILLYYGESEPYYPASGRDLASFLLRRNDPAQREIGHRVEELARRAKPDDGRDVDPPFGEEWDTDGEVMTFDDGGAVPVVARIAPPKVERDYEDAALFRLYSFSLRHNEMAEWQFRFPRQGDASLKILNRVTLPGRSCQ